MQTKHGLPVLPPPSDGSPKPAATWRDAAALTRRPWREHERSFGLWIHGAAARAWVVALLGAVSRVSDGWIWYAVVIALPWLGGAVGTSVSVRLVAVGAVDLLVYAILKRCVARPRPFRSCDGIHACSRVLDEYSFPSGHTMHAVAFGVVLTAYYPHLAWLVWPFAGLVVLSRLVLGLHYLSDVLAGAAIGASCAWVSFHFL